MFRGGLPNPYDDIVVKTTDENMTSENWELILNLCDKVEEEGEPGARNVIAAILKRLTHRNPNVQLYTLTLAESLTKNCSIHVHREIASRAFTQGLERLITDRTTHEKVRRRALSLIAVWTAEFEKDSTLDIMAECYENMKSKGYKFDTPEEAPPPDVDDEVRRREEEELQRVLEMSMHDKGGRGQWDAYSLASSSGAGASGTSKAVNTASSAQLQSSYSTQPVYGGYVPSPRPAISTAAPPSPTIIAPAMPAATAAPSTVQGSNPIVTRVRALHTFEPTEAGELAFEKGDIIKVVDRGYQDWWRGQLKGRTGIFPVNYVEPLPEPTAAEIAKEAEQEAAVFNQAVNVDRLLTMLRAMDPAKDSLADNEEIQELYRSCMSLRPKIVKLIDKYSQKRADLVSMNESFVKARTIFDRMMEDSLARQGVYDGRSGYPQPQQPSYQPNRDARGHQDYAGGPAAYGWNPTVYEQPGYNAYPAPAAAYAPVEPSYPGPQYAEPLTYAQHPQSAYPQYGATPASVQYAPQSQGVPQHIDNTPQPYGAAPPPASAPYAQVAAHPQGYSQRTDNTPQPYGPEPVQYAQPAQPQGVHQQAELSPQAQPQIAQQQLQSTPHVQPQQEPQVYAQVEPQTQPQQPEGPPYVFDPAATYPDPNAQAWAQYYAQGGTDPTGAVYFKSVPGISQGPPPAVRTSSQGSVNQVQQQPEQQQSAQPVAAQPASRPTTAEVQDTPTTPQPYVSPQQSLNGVLQNTSAAAMPGAFSRQSTVQAHTSYAAPYGAPAGYAAAKPGSPGAGGVPGAQQQWPVQHDLSMQMSRLNVGGEGGQSTSPLQGVGTSV